MHPIDKAIHDIVSSFIDVLDPEELERLASALAELGDYIKGKRTADPTLD